MNQETAPINDNILSIGNDDPVFFIPPYTVQQVFTTMAETIDWGIEMLGVPQLWRQTRGEGIKVAVLDTGIALNHNDLKDAIEDAKDFTGSKSGPYDCSSHGTHVAGIIAARENSSGVIGIAPKSKLLVAKVLGDDGCGTIKQICKGIQWAIDNNADIISMSLGSGATTNALHESIKAAYNKGIHIITAAGNEGPDLGTVSYPARYAETIAVGSIDRRRKISSFSSRGPQVDIVAPGDRILSTLPPNNLGIMSGSSMATPHVSGVVALMLSKCRKFGAKEPIKSAKDLRKVLRDMAIDLGPNGWDANYGSGLVNPSELLSTSVANVAEVSAYKIVLTEDDLNRYGSAKLDAYRNEFDSNGEIQVIIKKSHDRNA